MVRHPAGIYANIVKGHEFDLSKLESSLYTIRSHIYVQVAYFYTVHKKLMCKSVKKWLNCKKILGKLKKIFTIIFENSEIIQKLWKITRNSEKYLLKKTGKNCRLPRWMLRSPFRFLGTNELTTTLTKNWKSTPDWICRRLDGVRRMIRVDRLTTLLEFEALFYVREPSTKFELISASWGCPGWRRESELIAHRGHLTRFRN